MEVIAEYLPVDHRYQLGILDISLLLSVVEEYGLDADSLLNYAGLSDIDWHSQESHISYSDKLLLFHYVQKYFPNIGLGLLLGERATLSHFGILGYAVLSSRTVFEAIKAGFKYLDLNGPVFSVRVSRDDDTASIEIENDLEIGELLPFCTEYFFSSITSLFFELTGQQLVLQKLELPYPKPDYTTHYADRFRCNVIFEQPRCVLTFKANVMDLQLASHNSDLLSTYLHSCESVIAVLQSPTRLSNQIKAILYQSVGMFPSIDDIAVQHGCSVRTLRRLLTEEQTSYRELVDEVRFELSKEFLVRTHLTIEEIAFRLGYSDSANFRRSFKRWSGKAPSCFRAL
ncbi:AraC family transcriptional regulator [Vibrio coralliilyticus]|uniref:AraC family transcriptional regulator n=1 Tax=Vibrio coralliilyticus TaxID=190893 RepID=UPI000BAAE094|nr:AraC family transcriptional regulator [Vibrio coralliilyticus]PAU37789.1 AraC family transcriptional regulator [Vibrio coralliilyticus]